MVRAVAKTGDKDAAAKRDEIANALRPEQLERARAATELWKAKPLDPAANSADIPESWQSDTPQTTASVDMKKAVKNIQLILNKNGYEAGGADGVMGGKTKTAIMAFQTDNKMKPTGEVDEPLVKALLAQAEKHRVTCVCLFTRIPEFFSRMGFTTAAHQDLPDKIHKDCYQCPRLYRCDEVAMIRGNLPTFAILPPPKNWLKIQA